MNILEYILLIIIGVTVIWWFKDIALIILDDIIPIKWRTWE